MSGKLSRIFSNAVGRLPTNAAPSKATSGVEKLRPASQTATRRRHLLPMARKYLGALESMLGVDPCRFLHPHLSYAVIDDILDVKFHGGLGRRHILRCDRVENIGVFF